MKTSQMLFKKILFLSVIAASLIACEGNPDKTDDDGGGDYDGAPKQIITLANAKSMYDSYSQRRVPIIKTYEEQQDSTEKFYPTRYGQYDFETMKHYMAYIEDQAKLANVKISGLRYYLSNYPADGSVGSHKEYARHNSFFILPTTDFNGEELAFFIRVDDNGNRSAVPVRDVVKKPLRKNMKKGGNMGKQEKPSFGSKMLLLNPVFQGGGEDISLTLNDSHLVPPPNGKDDFGGN